MTRPTFTVLEAIEHQAAGCERAGSRLYATLLRGLASDHRAGGVTAELLDGVSERPLHDAVPLRYVATGHGLALGGSAPDLAAIYPSCGGSWTGDDPTPAFLQVVHDHRQAFVEGLRRTVQTNEVGRAVVLTAGFCTIAARHGAGRDGAGLRTLELGASAGLLSRWPSYHYDTGRTACGDPASPVRFGPEWFVPGLLPHLLPQVHVVERIACDVSPIDPATSDGRLRMLSFLWPDQLDRFERLRSALDVAAADRVVVDAADAGEWLAMRLGAPVISQAPMATVVFHSIVWQYLPPATRDAVRAALATAGAGATDGRPLCWLRMEPATPEHADLRLTTWAGTGRNTEEVLAEVGYHGAAVRWLASA